MSAVNAVELLFSAYRREILALLLLRELKALSEAGLLVREPAGNQIRYYANRGHPIYPELAEIFRKTVGLADVIRDALAPLAKKIDLALVFGSVAQGRETTTSDIDVMVLGRLPFASVVGALAPLRTRLGREINPVVMSKADFRNKLRGKDRFVTRVAKEPKIFLIGTADDFGKLAQDRAA